VYGAKILHALPLVHQPDSDGSVVRGTRRINPDEAAVVRRIFRDYAHGLSPRRIAHALNAEGAVSPSGTAWGPRHSTATPSAAPAS
jgi:site-specific DNA recombinase